MKPSYSKTIEEISVPNTTSDLWENLYSVVQNPILHFRDKVTYNLRLIGPFIYGSRIFIPRTFKLQDRLTSEEFKQILQGNVEMFNVIKSRIFKSVPDEARKKLHVESLDDIKLNNLKGMEIRNLLFKIVHLCYKLDGWQKVVFSNAIVLDSDDFSVDRSTVVCLNGILCNQIIMAIVESSKDAKDASKRKLSGVVAHDIIISRKGNGLDSKYTIKLSEKETPLNRQIISSVIKNGLWDIKKIAKEENLKIVHGSRSGFIYRITKEYKMSDELMKDVFGQVQKLNDAEYINEVEENIHNLPIDSFENHVGGNSIGSLEI
jgi:hypothetical protein